MATPSKNLITWRDTESGSHGIITHGLETPHYVVIDKSGRWQIQTLDANDKPVYVRTGGARNVKAAKAQATQAALGLLELTDDSKTTHKSDNAAPIVRMLKIYFGLTLLTLATLLFGRLLLVHRPWLFFRIIFWLGLSAFIAHRLILWAVNMSKRIDYLADGKRAPAAATVHAETMRMPSLPKGKQRKALPAGRKR